MMMRMQRLSILVVLSVLAGKSLAFAPQHAGARLVQRIALSAEPPTSESIQDDIEDMRTQAKERLKALNQKMEAWKSEKPVSVASEVTKEEKAVVATFTTTKKTKKENDALLKGVPSIPKEGTRSIQPLQQQQQRPARKPGDMDLLDDTRWKIVFNIGREPNTWMPAKWARSGERLLFHCVVDLTEEPLYERDDFFQGIAGAKVLQVVEAWVVPTGVGAASRGRRPISVKETGGYKVVPEKGPMGTDVLRLYIELQEEVHSAPGTDVYCPIGRVYGTCGYFTMHSTPANEVPWKEVLAQEHRAAKTAYDQAQMEVDSDENLISWDKMKNMKQVMDLRGKLNSVTERLRAAREFEPDKAQLRRSRDGRVALTREGGVCCKVTKGLAVEYHILGKMELASVKHDDEGHEHDHDSDRLNKLRP